MRFLFVADKEFTVFLTITDRTFTSNLNDIESLEFLNLAEKLQVAVSRKLFLQSEVKGKIFLNGIFELRCFSLRRFRRCLLPPLHYSQK